MIVQKFNSEQEWKEERKGKVTGTRLKDLVLKSGKKKKAGFYEIIAERVALPSDENESAMDRGKRLEEEAIARFEKETNKKVCTDLVMWKRDDNEYIALSPDGFIGKKDSPEEATEVKCLSSAKHIEAFLTGKIPTDYEGQKIQYFVTNDNLKKLYFIFYDPRMPKDFFYFLIERKDIEEDIQYHLELQRNELKEIEEAENLLTF